jgi:exonuclease III
MKIATYNVNGVNGRLPVLLDWLADPKPDVACLQELKAPDEKFPIDATREAGYEAVWHGQKAYNGVAIPARGEVIPVDMDWMPIGPVVTLWGGGLHVTNRPSSAPGRCIRRSP